MHFTSETSADGVREQLFTLGGLPGVLWTPAAEPALTRRPLVLLCHGGGQHKRAPGVVGRARRLVLDCGFAAVAVDVPNHGDRPFDEELSARAPSDRAGLPAFHALVACRTVPEWRSVLDALPGFGPVGYVGVSLGCGLGVPFVAAEPRVHAAVLGLGGIDHKGQEAARITVPVLFYLQWDDEAVPREQGLALFDAFGSAEKTLHANPGKHLELPRFEVESTVRFLARHLR